ncbi:conjugative transposon protein TraM [Tamlana fucoidanivorans]|uniref:Conjugative transposon protein TraM n=1 Tax=Allotamlana fucoidanivorans TaxID=2583814 RepID=A0A5C4SP80_9FLAO|nr:conjugative transposon protein TraM [Tamlana fucoidanivorans]TNJ46068.1 conjugative transposon protein TraM [Tamlana fucoidanivorans]
MHLDSKKIILIMLIACVIVFIIAYGLSLNHAEDDLELDTNHIPVPVLEETDKTYQSKREAIDALKEERTQMAPSVYNENLWNEDGIYDDKLLDKQKEELLDSIYTYQEETYTRQQLKPVEREQPKNNGNNSMEIEETKVTEKDPQTLALEHQLFFASAPKPLIKPIDDTPETWIQAYVDGKQTVQKDYRLAMRLAEGNTIGGSYYPKHTAVYGFVTFRPNRTIIAISTINHKPVKLKAYDFQDGNEGIYIENSFRAEARQELVDDLVHDINIAGVPNVSSGLNSGVNGIKRIFQRNNRNVKVTIADQYKLILKTDNR